MITTNKFLGKGEGSHPFSSIHQSPKYCELDKGIEVSTFHFPILQPQLPPQGQVQADKAAYSDP